MIPDSTDFFQTLRLLEAGGKRFGHGDSPEAEPARISQVVRLDFATDAVSGVIWREAAPPVVRIKALGLLGPEGPMPLHLTRMVLDRMSQRWFSGEAGVTADTTFADFCDMLQHRAIALYYRAWADTRPEVQVERETGGRVKAMLAAMAGIGLPGVEGALGGLAPIALRQAPSLARAPASPDQLIHFLRDAVRAPVSLREYVGNMMPTPRDSQSRLGRAFATLGRDAGIGPRVFMRQNRFALRIGPLDLDSFRAFLPGGARLAALERATAFVAGRGMDVEVQLVLRARQVPTARIHTANGTQLGRTAWLAGRRRKDADDMVIRNLFGERR